MATTTSRITSATVASGRCDVSGGTTGMNTVSPADVRVSTVVWLSLGTRAIVPTYSRQYMSRTGTDTNGANTSSNVRSSSRQERGTGGKVRSRWRGDWSRTSFGGSSGTFTVPLLSGSGSV